MLLNITNIIFPMLTFPYVSRILNPEGLGKTNYVSSIINYFSLIAGFGIATYGIREGSKYKYDKDGLSKFTTEMLVINCISSGIAYILLLALISMTTNRDYKILLIIYSITIFSFAFSFNWFYTVLEEYKFITIRGIAFQLIGMVSIFIFIKDSNDYFKYAIINTITIFMTTFINIQYSKKFIKLVNIRQCNIKKHIKPAIIILGILFSSTLYLNSDITILGIIKGDYPVGIYSVSVKLIKIITILVTSLSTVILARVSYYAKTNQDEQYFQLLKKGLNFILMLSIPLCIGMILLSKPLITLFSGDKYKEAVLTTQLMALNIIVSPLANFIPFQILLPYNNEKKYLFATTLSCIINIVGNLMFIPRYSQNAAAVTTVIAETCTIFCCMIFSRKIVNYKILLKELYQYIIAGFVMIPMVIIIENLITNMILQIFVSTIIGAVLYIVVLKLYKNNMFEILLSIAKTVFKRYVLRE